MITLCDSATKLAAEHRGTVVVCGSHGGLFPAYLAAKAGVRAVILSDAGLGLDDAGAAGLPYADALGLAAAVVGHDTARIGDAADMIGRGSVSRVNRTAGTVGGRPGMSCEEAARALVEAPKPRSAPAPMAEGRVVIAEPKGAAAVILVDSASLVRPEDADQIVVAGSHGSLVGGDPGMALGVDALAAFFHDAGVGIENAGIGRLPALDRRGVAAGAVDGRTARIGDARSLFETGALSHVNGKAWLYGLAPGLRLRDAVARLQEAD